MAPENDMNEVFTVQFDDSDVITVPIDDTLSNSGEAADAAAVGAALALKADKSELPATIKVNGQQADNQGLILVNGTHIPVNGDTQKTLAEAVEEVTDMTAETIPMSSNVDAETVSEAIGGIRQDVSDLQEAIDGMEEQTAASILMETGSTTTVKNAIETLDRKTVKSVNRKLPDAAGDVDLSVVPLAENLQSDKLQNIEGEFILRTTGGNGSVADGKAYPQHIFGNSRHDGFVPEVLNLTVIPITRTEPDEPITATIDRDTFVAEVTEDSTINLYYTTEWSDDPEDYGVTVTGDPVAGDQITIVYVKEVRGTIVVADPARLVGTGWNLYDANAEYARVVKYSDVYGYKIGGTYTSITFSPTLTGERTSLLPNANGLFNVTSDGYVFVTGGNATDTYILATWSDWTNGPSTGYWEAYRESGIDLSAVVETYFPYGMLKIGSVRDEIDLVAKKTISRIERMVYSAENRATAEASGRAYDFDESNIYLVRAESVQSAITIGTDYTVSEHGLEWFTETELPLDTEILYGKNLRDKLERDVVTISAQTLTEEEKAQVRTNIGAMSQAEGDTKLVAPTAAGTTGQLLSLKADGGTEWTTQGTPTDTQVGTAVSAWLEAHPEATTTVEDGAISRAKLNADLQAKTDAVPELKSAFDLYQKGTLPIKIIKNEYVIPATGAINHYNGWDRTDYTIVKGYKSIKVKSSANSVYNVFYDENKEKCGTFGVETTEKTIQVPDDAVYVILSNTAAGMAALETSIITKNDVEIENIKDDIADINNGITAIESEIEETREAFVQFQLGELPTIIVKGQYVDAATGEIKNNNNYDRTDFIPVNQYSSITVKSSVASPYNAFYGADKETRISGFSFATTETMITIPQNAVYAVMSNTVAGMESLETSFTTKLETEIYNEVEVGSSLTPIPQNLICGLGTPVDRLTAMANGIDIDKFAMDERCKIDTNVSWLTHDSTIVIVDGKIYCAVVENDVDMGDSPSNPNAYVRLAIVDTTGFGASSTVTRIDIAKYGDTINEKTVTSGVGVPNIVAISSNVVRIIFSARLSDGVYYLFYRDYTISSGTLGTVGTCTFTKNGTSHDFTVPNISEYITPVSYLDYFISMNAQIGEKSGTYYAGVCVGNDIKSSIIFTSENMKDFDLWLLPDFENNDAVFEGACICKGNYLYYALRQEGVNLPSQAEETMIIAKIDLTTKETALDIRINDAGARACWYLDGNDLYLIHNVINRKRAEVILIDESNLYNSRIVAYVDDWCIYPSCVGYDGNIYFSATGSSSTHVYLRRCPTLKRYTVKDVESKIASALRLNDAWS